MERTIVYVLVQVPFLLSSLAIVLLVENGYVNVLIASLLIALLIMISGIIDMLQMLKRFGVEKINYKLNISIFKEVAYILKYSVALHEGVLGSIDMEAAYTRKRYTNLFYEKFKIHPYDGYNYLMVEQKLERANSKSSIMKNNLPKNITNEKICEVWREPGTDLIYYGSLTIINIMFYIWFFLAR